MATLLVVDDRPLNREYLALLLGRIGHRVLEAGDGAEALDSVRAHHPDLVITDVLMPAMDGYEFVRRLRSDTKIAATPVIFYTAAYHEKEMRSLALSCGVLQVLIKPADPEEIVSLVNEALGAGVRQEPAVPLEFDEEFDREHLRLVTNKLSQKANDLEMANLRLQALVEAGRSLAAQRDPAGLLGAVCAAARQIAGARHSMAGVLDAGAARFQCVGSAGFRLPDGPDSPAPDQGVLGRLLAQAEGFILPDLAADPLAGCLPPSHTPARSFLGVPIRSPGAVYGVLCLTEKLGAAEFGDEDLQIAEALAAQTAIVCENIRRHEQLGRHAADLEREVADRAAAQDRLRQSEQQLRSLANRIRQTREEERTRIAREVHDQLGQNLTALKMDLVHLTRHIVPGGNLEEWIEQARAMTALVDSTIETVQRISSELRPGVLDLGLLAAIEWQTQEFQTRTGISCLVQAPPEGVDLGRQSSTEVFRILQEVLTNVARHSHATEMRIAILDQPGQFVLEVRDNGVGIAPEQIADPRSLGLVGMRERALLIGAVLSFNGVPAGGTTVRLTVPSAPAEPA